MRNRRGFTLIEMMIAVTILVFVMGVTVQYLRKQTNLLTAQTARMDALQNAEFSVSQIERELREAGSGVVDAQPMLVQLDSEAITFNANMVSIDSGDVRAVYQMTDAKPEAVRAMLVGEAVALPNSVPVKSYPDTTYFASKGVESGAETISYWLRPDSSSKYPKRYALFRRVNALPPTLVSRGIVKDGRDSVPIFTYFTQDSLGRLKPVPKSQYPLYHAKVHGISSDTGFSALTDSIRVVRVHFLAAARDPRTGKDALRTIETRVRLMNSGLLHHSACGEKPYGPGTPAAASSAAGAPVPLVTLTWAASSDDGSGEKDIERYAIFRRLSTDMAFADPIASIPASTKLSYSFTDTQVVPGQTYLYGVAAQDCTPQMSPLTPAAVTVTVNP
jgi:prepilin-type N-terminal cleavage/methylation domain-containing protein